jgi:hypothetical protein
MEGDDGNTGPIPGKWRAKAISPFKRHWDERRFGEQNRNGAPSPQQTAA